MKFKKHSGLEVADKVLAQLQELSSRISKEVMEEFSIQSFDNCKEQGYALKSSKINFGIVRNRNSDAICIYTYKNCSFPSNLPVESEWEVDYFKYNEFGIAAMHIVNQINIAFEI